MGKERAHELDNVTDEMVGEVLSAEIMRFLDILGVPRGLAQVGYGRGDVGKVSHVG
jgi:hypothetical protein